MNYLRAWDEPSMRNGDAADFRLRRPGFDALAERLKSVVLLGGSVRRSRLVQATGRSVVDLPLTQRQTILGHWVEQIGELADTLGRETLAARMVVGGKVPTPRVAPDHRRVTLVVEGDSGDYRGTAGLLRDKTLEDDDQDLILVASAGQVLLEPLANLALGLAEAGGDANLMSHRDGLPAGLMLFTAASLRDVPEVGYQDFKEQALPNIARRRRVQVVTRDRHAAAPVRTVHGYIEAIRRHHRRRQRDDRGPHFFEDWRSTFSVVEPGAEIGGEVLIHDSVVLRGAKLESHSTLVRSVACPGSTLGGHARATDLLLEGRWKRVRKTA